jgi:hypothetical protein
MTCVIVTAETAVHVRDAADARADVAGWLRYGDVARVTMQPGGNWWFVERDGLEGWVRVDFLALVSCD